jgi:outer membrane biosynthesis protein TonB
VRFRHSSLLSLLLAAALHVAVVAALLTLKLPERTATTRLAFELVSSPQVAADAPEPIAKIEPAPPPRRRPRATPLPPPPPADVSPASEIEANPAPLPTAAQVSPAPTTSAPTPSTTAEALVPRQRGADGLLDRVIARGQPSGIDAKLPDLERAIPHRAPGPMSDAKRAERSVTGFLKGALAAQDVQRGMVDDWFRDVRKGINRTWRPSNRELNDPSQGTRAVILGEFALNPKQWGEFGPLYLTEVLGLAQRDLVKDPTLQTTPDPSAPPVIGQSELSDAQRRARIATMLATSKQAFRYVARARLIVRHRADGGLDSIEVVHASGHEHLDEGMVGAIERALFLAGNGLPTVDASDGKGYASEWMMSAVWQVIPPRCIASTVNDPGAGPSTDDKTVISTCGSSWDITPDGVEIERPFELKLKTDVELLGVSR